MFIFPSETDTYGNVVLEAMASGLPVVVSAHGGPKFLVKAGVNGYIASTAEEFRSAVMDLYTDPGRLRQMRSAAREAALGRSWDSVFTKVSTATVTASQRACLRCRRGAARDWCRSFRPSRDTGRNIE